MSDSVPWLAMCMLLLVGAETTACHPLEGGNEPVDGSASDASADADASHGLGYPAWVFEGTCGEPVLGPVKLDVARAPTDGLAHPWTAGLPGYAYSEAELHELQRCILRYARELGMDYISSFLAANAFGVIGTVNQASELSRDSRLDSMVLDRPLVPL